MVTALNYWQTILMLVVLTVYFRKLLSISEKPIAVLSYLSALAQNIAM